MFLVFVLFSIVVIHSVLEQLAILKMWLLQFICVNVVKSNNLLWMHAISHVTYILYSTTPSVICTMSIEAFSELNQLPFQLKAMAKNQFAHEWNYCYPPCNPFDFRELMGKKTPPIQWNIGKYANGKREKKRYLTETKQNKRTGKKMPNQNWKSILMSKIYLFSWLFANLESQINVLCSWSNWLGYINGIHTIRTWCMSALLVMLLGFCIVGYLCHHSLNEMAYFLIDLLYNKNEGQNGNFMRNALTAQWNDTFMQ